MITTADIVQVPVDPAEVQFARECPVEGHKHILTGQLKTLGGLAVMHVLGVPVGEFALKQQESQELGANYVWQTGKGKPAGLDPAVMLVRESNVLVKHVTVPANQLLHHDKLSEHYTVAVFVVGGKDQNGELGMPSAIMVAGWDLSKRLIRWIKKGGTPPFRADNMSLAVTPCEVLMPMCYLSPTVQSTEVVP